MNILAKITAAISGLAAHKILNEYADGMEQLLRQLSQQTHESSATLEGEDRRACHEDGAKLRGLAAMAADARRTHTIAELGSYAQAIQEIGDQAKPIRPDFWELMYEAHPDLFYRGRPIT